MDMVSVEDAETVGLLVRRACRFQRHRAAIRRSGGTRPHGADCAETVGPMTTDAERCATCDSDDPRIALEWYKDGLRKVICPDPFHASDALPR